MMGGGCEFWVWVGGWTKFRVTGEVILRSWPDP